MHEKATAAKKAYNKKGSGFLLAQGAQQESAADGAPAAPGVDTSAAPAATAEATADEAGSTRSPGPSATRSAGRGVLVKSPNPKAKSAHVAFADEAPRQPYVPCHALPYLACCAGRPSSGGGMTQVALPFAQVTAG